MVSAVVRCPDTNWITHVSLSPVKRSVSMVDQCACILRNRYINTCKTGHKVDAKINFWLLFHWDILQIVRLWLRLYLSSIRHYDIRFVLMSGAWLSAMYPCSTVLHIQMGSIGIKVPLRPVFQVGIPPVSFHILHCDFMEIHILLLWNINSHTFSNYAMEAWEDHCRFVEISAT